MTFLSDETEMVWDGAALTPRVERSVTDKLVAEKKRLERRLKDINRALDTLANNPEVQIALDAISRLGPL
jgi:hypothetical protein